MSNSEQLTRPSKVATAVKLMYASIVIGMIRWLFIIPYLHERIFTGSYFIMISFVLAILLFFIYMTGKGKDWARITILALFTLSILINLVSLCVSYSRSMLIPFVSDNPISFVFGSLAFCLNVAGLVLLFQSDSSTWFRAIKKLKKAQPVT